MLDMYFMCRHCFKGFKFEEMAPEAWGMRSLVMSPTMTIGVASFDEHGLPCASALLLLVFTMSVCMLCVCVCVCCVTHIQLLSNTIQMKSM